MFQNHITSAQEQFDAIARSLEYETELERRKVFEVLKFWGTGIIHCSADMLLSCRHHYVNIVWPVLSGAVFVFNDVHCYDEPLFHDLLAFLEKRPGAEVLLMADALPKIRREAIENVMRKTGEA